MVDQFRILTGHDHLAHENGGDAVALAAIVLVEGNDKKTVVGRSPLRVTVKVLLQPAIALLDRAVVHVIVEVRYHE